MPTFADTSRVQMRYILESTFGTIPVAGNPSNLRMTGESLEQSISGDSSKEIRPDRQKSGFNQLNAAAGGGVNFELSYIEFDPLLEAVLQGTWAKYGTNGVGSTFTADFAATTITASVAPVGANAFTTLTKGQWFKLVAPTHANNGKYFRISSSVAPTSTVITVDAATPLATGTGVTLCTVGTSRLMNGTTMRSFTFEKEFNDVAQFFAYRGMNLNTMSLAMQSGSFVTGAFGLMGKDGVRNAATQMPGSPVASQTFNVMSAVSGIGNIMEGGSNLTGTFIKSLNMQIDNKLRARDAIGNLGAVSVGSGTLEVTGTMEVYLADGTLYDKFQNVTASSINVRVVDPAGNGYVIQIPNINYKDAKVQAGSKDQDAMISLPFDATLDSSTGSTGKTLIIDRVGIAG
jgi:hypothetical protein